MSSAIPHHFKVLLFEDTPDDEALALRAFRASGLDLEIEIARNGQEALNTLGIGVESNRNYNDIPDLVISDLKMPMATGAEVLARARMDARLLTLPYVLFSSSDDPGDVKICMDLGASAYCVKPVDYSSYKKCLWAILERWLSDERAVPPCALQMNATA